MREKPPYASFDSPMKFQAIQGIIARRLREHPKAICSYSGGSDSDILIDLLERSRKMFNLAPIKYVFFNTGLEMKATKRHVRETAEKYGVEIEEIRPKKGIVTAVREYGIPFISKQMSLDLHYVQKYKVPFSIAWEFQQAEDKKAKLKEFQERYNIKHHPITFLCSCNSDAEPICTQTTISCAPYLLDFLNENPIPFRVSDHCCSVCKKRPSHEAQKGYEVVITGERIAEGGVRSIHKDRSCFDEQRDGTYRMRPLFYVSDRDKAWYKNEFGIRYSDAYEVYGLKRTGCTGCPINAKATEELERIAKYEPQLAKAAWNVFGASYEYRRKYNEYKAMRRAEEKRDKDQISMC